MVIEENQTEDVLDSIIKSYLKPVVKKIDADAYYAEDYLLELGKAGLYRSDNLTKNELLAREILIVEKTAETCMTTAFNLWCHLAALTYLRNSDNQYLKNEILPSLERGDFLGATGLSNPMKYYSGLEPLHLRAQRQANGYVISGGLPSVSNLNENHWFGAVASLDENSEVMVFVPSNADGLKLKEKRGYMGVNGSATYGCRFDEVFIPDEWVIAAEVSDFIDKIRPFFVLYQTPLGLGVIKAAIKSMWKAPKRQGDINEYLPVQPEDIKRQWDELKYQLEILLRTDDLGNDLKALLQLKLDISNLAVKAAHGDMMYYGGAGYLQGSHPSRRLRETYFLLNLTPTLKHLEKELATYKDPMPSFPG
ncbi:acyl-CoA dehydrogenase family protein [Salinicoccus halitifaciens]|uniref:Alkylation response protein AidB-like acyl-CoA dehydrogenase n=1 Tax=Salinicoccus halitifaciens TaxID=1073415 RepID=A0ABV2EA92_9STAP|nr:acyl-CoA dehydrogenase family protein [Salinicoccus halitifaciens]MCD2138476.1 acyl-CoA/acyl-ACP dehydrogenase [Salinicoccus halitifaciens]